MAVTFHPRGAPPSTLPEQSAQEPSFGRIAPAADHRSDQALSPLFRRVAGGVAQNVTKKIGSRFLEQTLPLVGRDPKLRKQMTDFIANRMWTSGYRESVRTRLERMPQENIRWYRLGEAEQMKHPGLSI